MIREDVIKFLLKEENQILLDNYDFDKLYENCNNRFTRPYIAETLAELLGLSVTDILVHMSHIPTHFIEGYWVKDLVIPSSITSIDENGLVICKFKSVTIPSSITSIGEDAFEYCSDAEDVYYNGSASQWASISFANYRANPLFYAKNLHLNGTLATSIVIDNTPIINDYAFYNCTGLTEVTIAGSVKHIGRKAFKHCTDLKHVTIKKGMEEIDVDAFSCCGDETGIDITYEGTHEEFWKIKARDNRYFSWYKNTLVTIHCTDRDLVYED